MTTSVAFSADRPRRSTSGATGQSTAWGTLSAEPDMYGVETHHAFSSKGVTMWTDQELSTTLERVNPVPDPGMSPDHGDRLWASLASKREDRARQRIRSPYRRRATLVMVALAVLVAVPAVASLLDGPPPLDREFPSGDQAMLTVYSSEQGVPDGCARKIAFAPTGTPLVGGSCGV